MTKPKFTTSMNLQLARMVLDRVEAPQRAKRKARDARDAEAEAKRLARSHHKPSKRARLSAGRAST